MKKLLLCLLLAIPVYAAPQPAVDATQFVHSLILNPPALMQIQGQKLTLDSSGNLEVNCITGCSATSGFVDNSTFTVSTSVINPIGAYYTSGSAPTLSSGNAGRVRMDSSSYLYVNCVVGCSGGSTTPADAFANPTTAGLSFSLFGGFNGATWDRLRDDTNKYLYVDLGTAIPAGTNVIGHVIVDSSGLPSNAAQETGGNLASIKTDTDKIPSQGQALAAASLPVVLTAAQITTLTPPAAITNYANETGGNLASIKTDTDKIPSQGQALAAASMPVVLTAAQITILTPPAAITNFANETGGNLAAIKADTDKIPASPATAANQCGSSAASSCAQGGEASGSNAVYLNCDNTAVYDASTNGTTQLVALSSGKIVYVCGYQISTSQTSAVHVALEYGTGTACATSPTKITPNYPLQAATSTGPIGLAVMTPGFTGLKTIASNELCILTDAAASVQAIVWYTQF